VFERVEANVFMAVSLGQKLQNAPRLLSVFIENNIGLRSNSTSRVEVENLRSRHWKVCLNHPACLPSPLLYDEQISTRFCIVKYFC
jgi:hypothetical protein